MNKKSKKPDGTPPKLNIVGNQEGMGRLDSVRPNSWNANEMTDEEREAVSYGLRKRWLKSQKLLIWRTNEKGEVMNIILDGEHRWVEAKKLGYAEAPMVWVDGITEEEAEKITIELMMKRGQPNHAKLATSLKRIKIKDVKVSALELGVSADFISKAIGKAPPPPPLGTPPVYRTNYAVIVKCTDEAHQKKLVDRFKAEGLACSPMKSKG